MNFRFRSSVVIGIASKLGLLALVFGWGIAEHSAKKSAEPVATAAVEAPVAVPTHPKAALMDLKTLRMMMLDFEKRGLLEVPITATLQTAAAPAAEPAVAPPVLVKSPIWLDTKGTFNAAFYERLEKLAQIHGLEQLLPKLATVRKAKPENISAVLEKATLNLAYSLAGVDPVYKRDIDERPVRTDYTKESLGAAIATLLQEENGEEKLLTWLESLAPQHPHYVALRKALPKHNGHKRTAILASMASWRTLTINNEPTYLVNIAAAAGEYWVDGMPSGKSHKLVLGEHGKTPVFAPRKVSGIIFQPEWIAPPKLAKKYGIDGMKASTANPLGWFKIQYDSGWVKSVKGRNIDTAVLAHYTASPHLFDKIADARYFSSGCIRIGNPEDFIRTAFAADPAKMPDLKRVSAQCGKRWCNRQYEGKTYALPSPFFLMSAYLPATVDAKGKIVFHSDPYGLTEKVAAPLYKTPQVEDVAVATSAQRKASPKRVKPYRVSTLQQPTQSRPAFTTNAA